MRTPVVVELPPAMGHALGRYARRVELEPAELLVEALRAAPWFRDAARESLPIELVDVSAPGRHANG